MARDDMKDIHEIIQMNAMKEQEGVLNTREVR